MPATATDRLFNLTTSVAVKPACVAVTSANITLTGLQTIGGVVLAEGDRVLVRVQTSSVDNGIYNASTSDWTRAKDFDGARDVVQGTLVLVRSSVVQGAIWEVTTANPVIIGTSAIVFSHREDPAITYVQTQAEISASVTPVNYAYPPYDIRRYGAVGDGVTDSTAAINAAISAAVVSSGGAPGSSVLIPNGTFIISSQITLPNHVRLLGANKEASVIKAAPSWNSGTYPYMFLADNGASSMFDSLTESVLFDCTNIVGLGTVKSNAWQNNCGPRKALYWRFTTYGILFSQAGYAISGGADILPLEDIEIFGSTTTTPTAGIKVEEVSSVANCVLHIVRAVIAGSPGHLLPRGIDIVKDSSILEKCHFEYVTTGIYLDGVGSHVLINCSTDTNSTNLVEIASTFTGTLTMIGCRRGGATNFIKDNRSGGVGTLASVDLPFFQLGTASRGVSADNTVKAWCTFDGTATGTNAPTSGFNVTSVTRVSAGTYTVNFTNPLTNTNAVLHVMTALDTTDSWWAADTGFGLGTAGFTVRRGGGSAGAKVDTTPIKVMVVGLGT